jgi:hypothetical protein
MKIELYNDNKGKPQSFEATGKLNDSFDVGYYIAKIEAYGSTEKESFSNLIKMANGAINQINNLIEKLERNEEEEKNNLPGT